MTGDILVTTASWEERFPAGTERSLGLGSVARVLVAASERYAAETRGNRERVRRACDHASVAHEERLFDFESQVEAYRQVAGIAAQLGASPARSIIVDVSTMPRSIAWLLLGALRASHQQVTVRYSRALEYDDWQTSEEGEPKLIINRSGIMYPDLPTCLVMLCGPEISRAEKLCYRFEPKKALILRDPLAGDFGIVKQLPDDYRDVTSETAFDNKDVDEANVRRLAEIIEPYRGDHNIVAASLGPKLGAILLFKLSEMFEGVGLSYVTSGRHNLSATRGLGEMRDVQLKLGAGDVVPS